MNTNAESKYAAKVDGTAGPATNQQGKVQTFVGEWDAEGVYVYQAYRSEIAEYALANQKFGGPAFKTKRMTWIKPSFAWMLYRSGYGTKPGQERVLKIKVSHDAMAHILTHCSCTDANRYYKLHTKEDGGNAPCNGRVQWDPERDILTPDGNVPRKMERVRAVQIGMQGKLSEYYVENILNVEEVTDLAHRVRAAHRAKGLDLQRAAIDELRPMLPVERPYLPSCHQKTLESLGMLPGETANVLGRIGCGAVT